MGGYAVTKSNIAKKVPYTHRKTNFLPRVCKSSHLFSKSQKRAKSAEIAKMWDFKLNSGPPYRPGHLTQKIENFFSSNRLTWSQMYPKKKLTGYSTRARYSRDQKKTAKVWMSHDQKDVISRELFFLFSPHIMSSIFSGSWVFPWRLSDHVTFKLYFWRSYKKILKSYKRNYRLKKCKKMRDGEFTVFYANGLSCIVRTWKRWTLIDEIVVQFDQNCGFVGLETIYFDYIDALQVERNKTVREIKNKFTNEIPVLMDHNIKLPDDGSYHDPQQGSKGTSKFTFLVII